MIAYFLTQTKQKLFRHDTTEGQTAHRWRAGMRSGVIGVRRHRCCLPSARACGPVYWQTPPSRSQMSRASQRDLGVVGGDDDGRHPHRTARSVHRIVVLAHEQLGQ